MEPIKRVTLRDIAEECDCTVNTVSRALRNDKKLSEDTRNRIVAKALEMGYVRNISASSLRSGKTNTIAVILDDFQNMHYLLLFSEMDYLLRQLGYVVMILNSHNDQGLESQLIEDVISRGADGIILFPSRSTPTDEIKHLSRQIPIVLVHRPIEDVSADLVRIDDCQGGYLAAEALIRHGYRDFLFVAGNETNISQPNRWKGFCRALVQYGLDPEKVRTVKGSKLVKALDAGNGLPLIEPIRNTGIFAFHDQYAYKVLYYLISAGYREHEDFSIVGFDYIRSGFDYLPLIPSISTKPGTSLARETVDLLIRRIRDPNAEFKTITLPAFLFEEQALDNETGKEKEKKP